MDNFFEVEKVVMKIGMVEIFIDIMLLEVGDIFVIFKFKVEWIFVKIKEGFFVKMEIELNKFLGVIYEFI